MSIWNSRELPPCVENSGGLLEQISDPAASHREVLGCDLCYDATSRHLLIHVAILLTYCAPDGTTHSVRKDGYTTFDLETHLLDVGHYMPLYRDDVRYRYDFGEDTMRAVDEGLNIGYGMIRGYAEFVQHRIAEREAFLAEAAVAPNCWLCPDILRMVMSYLPLVDAGLTKTLLTKFEFDDTYLRYLVHREMDEQMQIIPEDYQPPDEEDRYWANQIEHPITDLRVFREWLRLTEGNRPFIDGDVDARWGQYQAEVERYRLAELEPRDDPMAVDEIWEWDPAPGYEVEYEQYITA